MKKNRLLIIAATLIIVLATTILIFSKEKTQDTSGITNFEICAAAGYPVAESSPRQCSTPDGKNFTEELPQGMPTENAEQETAEPTSE